MDVMFYEAFAEEQEAVQRYLPAHIRAEFTPQTIQEKGSDLPPAPLISIRTQSQIPVAWGKQVKGILTRSTGYDHLAAFRKQTQTKASLGHLPEYCSRAEGSRHPLPLRACSVPRLG